MCSLEHQLFGLKEELDPEGLDMLERRKAELMGQGVGLNRYVNSGEDAEDGMSKEERLNSFIKSLTPGGSHQHSLAVRRLLTRQVFHLMKDKDSLTLFKAVKAVAISHRIDERNLTVWVYDYHLSR